MAKHTPILASSKTAAQLLDLSEAEFSRLVEAGALPRPIDIGGGHLRWDVPGLQRILTGVAIDGMEEVKWA